MNQEPKQLPVPSLNPEQVQALMNYANEQIPMKYGKDILLFIENAALEIEKAKQTEEEAS